MSWFSKPDDRIYAQETAQTQEAYGLLLRVVDNTAQIDHRLALLLYKYLSPDELRWLQNRFDQDSGDPRIPESARPSLGPVWPVIARRELRYAMFNNRHRITEQQVEGYETVVDLHNFATASLLTEDPGTIVPLACPYGIELYRSKALNTRFGMVSTDIWILIGADAKGSAESSLHKPCGRATDRVHLVYAKVSDPWDDAIQERDFLMRGVVMRLDSNGEMPVYNRGESIGGEISSLDNVVLLKHIIRRSNGFLERKSPDFNQQIRNAVGREAREFIGGKWYQI